MRIRISILNILLILSVIGCRESMVTEPIDSMSKKGNFSTTDTIDLCCQLPDPGGGNCQLKGIVVYGHQIIENPGGEIGISLVSLKMFLDSKLCDVDEPVMTNWTIEGHSADVFHVSEEGIYILNKVYIIENRMDIVLAVQYLVTTEGVGIPNLWLQEVDKINMN